ncbi:MAG: hypothetical protein QNL03_04235 [Gammaproteobacteria bacterium]|nr:hypothetical protein [Gammaproteobacteria bacterium]
MSVEEKKILKEIVLQELQEIDEELAQVDNDDIHLMVLFHIDHGIRDVETRLEAGEETELEYPFDISDELIKSLNLPLLQVEVWLKYYYKALFFGSKEQQLEYRKKILDYIG